MQGRLCGTCDSCRGAIANDGSSCFVNSGRFPCLACQYCLHNVPVDATVMWRDVATKACTGDECLVSPADATVVGVGEEICVIFDRATSHLVMVTLPPCHESRQQADSLLRFWGTKGGSGLAKTNKAHGPYGTYVPRMSRTLTTNMRSTSRSKRDNELGDLLAEVAPAFSHRLIEYGGCAALLAQTTMEMAGTEMHCFAGAPGLTTAALNAGLLPGHVHPKDLSGSMACLLIATASESHSSTFTMRFNTFSGRQQQEEHVSIATQHGRAVLFRGDIVRHSVTAMQQTSTMQAEPARLTAIIYSRGSSIQCPLGRSVLCAVPLCDCNWPKTSRQVNA
jgi:hypothetical protein